MLNYFIFIFIFILFITFLYFKFIFLIIFIFYNLEFNSTCHNFKEKIELIYI